MRQLGLMHGDSSSPMGAMMKASWVTWLFKKYAKLFYGKSRISDKATQGSRSEDSVIRHRKGGSEAFFFHYDMGAVTGSMPTGLLKGFYCVFTRYIGGKFRHLHSYSIKDFFFMFGFFSFRSSIQNFKTTLNSIFDVLADFFESLSLADTSRNSRAFCYVPPILLFNNNFVYHVSSPLSTKEHTILSFNRQAFALASSPVGGERGVASPQIGRDSPRTLASQSRGQSLQLQSLQELLAMTANGSGCDETCPERSEGSRPYNEVLGAVVGTIGNYLNMILRQASAERILNGKSGLRVRKWRFSLISAGVRLFLTSATMNRGMRTKISSGDLAIVSMSFSQAGSRTAPRAKIYSLLSRMQRKFLLPEFFPGFTDFVNYLLFAHPVEARMGFRHKPPYFVYSFQGFLDILLHGRKLLPDNNPTILFPNRQVFAFASSPAARVKGIACLAARLLASSPIGRRGSLAMTGITIFRDSPHNLVYCNDEKFGAAARMLGRVGQGHLLDGWAELTEIERENLLRGIESVDWDRVTGLYNELVANPKEKDDAGIEFTSAKPKLKRRPEAAAAGEQVLRFGAKEGKAQFGFIVVFGGTGSGLKYPHPKAMFPATPLSSQSFILGRASKIYAASQAYGHTEMYPSVFMARDEEERDEIIEYLKRSGLWKEVNTRMLFVYHREFPGLIRKPGASEDGKAFLNRRDSVNLGGRGHAEALDYILNADENVRGLVWQEETGDFVEAEVVPWLGSFGIKYMQYLDIDNNLAPAADKYFIGEHILSRTPGNIAKFERKERLAHISVGMVKKLGPDDRLGNVIIVGENKQRRKQSRDYADASDEIKAQCVWGTPSFMVVTLESLAGSNPTPFSVAKKTDKDLHDEEVPIYKFEASSGNKPRYGIEFGYENREDVFAPVKTPENVPVAKKQQSAHWKRLIQEAMPGISIPESAVIELPWDADFTSPDELKERLSLLNFAYYLQENSSILITAGFKAIKTSGYVVDVSPVFRVRFAVRPHMDQNVDGIQPY